MMKKFLFVAAAVVASMVFTGCINEDDTYKKLQPVEKGINIYNWTSSQYSMRPTSVCVWRCLWPKPTSRG